MDDEPKMKKFYDTCSALNMQDRILDEPFILSYITLRELEHIKVSSSKSEEVKYKARCLTRLLTDNIGNFEWYEGGKEKAIQLFDDSNDSIILAGAIDYAAQNNITFVTDDLLLRLLAGENGLNVIGSEDILGEDDEYKGFQEILMSDNDMADFYTHPDRNPFGCLVNEYLLIKNTSGEIVDKQKWSGTSFKQIGYKTFNNDFLGRVKPRNAEQELAFDLLQDTVSKVKVLSGVAGGGKDFCSLTNALHLIKQNKFKKILWVRNNIEVKNTKPIGFLPGSLEEKLVEFAMPIADIVGGKEGLLRLMSDGILEMAHLGFLRGRGLQNTLILSSEIQNCTTDIMQILISRIGEGSALWVNGDYRQTDDRVFQNDNGLKNMISRLKGNPLFGYVQLNQVERSDAAQLAELLY